MAPRPMAGIVWEGRLLGVVTATLAVFGVAAVYGASSIWAVQNGQPGSYFALRQLGGLLFGTMLLLIAVRVDFRRWRQYAWSFLGIAVVLLIVPLLPFTRAIAPEVNGARRWLNFGFFTIQPSEVAKLAVVMWTAMLAAKKGEGVRDFKSGVVPFLTILVPVCALILFEPDLSSAAVVAFLAGIVLFAAGARIGHFLVLGLVAIPILWHEIARVQYRLARMVSFLSEGSDAGEQSWQITQSLTGIGAGQLVGVGFGEGFQKLGYLPYAYSDFLFSTIGEEWGFVGVTLIVLLFGTYLMLGIRIARTAPDAFGTLLAVGITSMIGLGAFLHMAVTLDLVPTTGIGLPFLSYGRSSLLVSLFATGMLINIGHARSVRGQG